MFIKLQITFKRCLRGLCNLPNEWVKPTMEPTTGRNYWSDNGSNRRKYLVEPGKVPGLPGFFSVKPGIPYPVMTQEKLPAICLPFPVGSSK